MKKAFLLVVMAFFLPLLVFANVGVLDPSGEAVSSYLQSSVTTMPPLLVAGGDRVGQPDLTPIVDEDGCIIIVPSGIDVEDCIETMSSPQSGFSSWICGGISVQVTCGSG